MIDLSIAEASATFFVLLFVYLAAIATVPWLAARKRRGAPTWFAAALIPSLLAGVGAISIGWLAIVSAWVPLIVLVTLALLPAGAIDVPKIEGLRRLRVSTLLGVYAALAAALALAGLAVVRAEGRRPPPVTAQDAIERGSQAIEVVIAQTRQDGSVFQEWLTRRLLAGFAQDPGIHSDCSVAPAAASNGLPSGTTLEWHKPIGLFGMNVSADGLAFNPGTNLPEEFDGDLFVTEWGNLFGSTPKGHKIVRVTIEAGPRARLDRSPRTHGTAGDPRV